MFSFRDKRSSAVTPVDFLQPGSINTKTKSHLATNASSKSFQSAQVVPAGAGPYFAIGTVWAIGE
jgi:hypothetical protein